MEFLALLFLVFIGIILIGSIMGMTSSGRITKLERQNRDLNTRLKLMEKALDAQKSEPLAAPLNQATQKAEGSAIPDVAPTRISAPIAEPVPHPKPEPKPEPKLAAPVPERQIPPQPATPKAAAAAAAPAAQKFVPDWSSPPKVQKPARSLEERIGGQWSVWVGGLALLVGAVLLIRFSIEAGIFGPGARIIMALVLGGVLLLAGEWLKRSDERVLKGKLGEAAKVLQDNASVPGLLSAVGIFTLLGASYAAHALYGLIPALAAFVALALISLGALALSLRQGRLLAGIGLLGSLATPLLIQMDTPSLLKLILYLVLVGGAALALCRRAGWGWLATGTVFGWLGWSFMSYGAASSGQLLLWSAFLALGFIVTVWFAEQHEALRSLAEKADGPSVVVSDSVEGDIGTGNLGNVLNIHPVWAIVWGAFAAILVAFLVGYTGGYGRDDLSVSSLALGLGSIGALTAASLLFWRQSAHLVTASLLALIVLTMTDTHLQTIILMVSLTGLVILSFLKTESQNGVGDRSLKTEWSVFAIALGLVSVVVLSFLNAGEAAQHIHTATALGFTALFAAVSWWFRKRGAAWDDIAAPVIGAGLGWALAALLGFENLGFSLFLSLGGVLSGLAIWRSRMPGARFVLLGLAGMTFGHAFFIQFPDAGAIAPTPIFNALWIYLALPAFILAAAAYALRRHKAESGLETFLNGAIEAAALAGFALFAVFQIRHLSNSGEVYADSLGHAELGLQISIGLCFTLAGLSKRFAGNPVLSKIAEVISYVTLAAFALGALFFISPLFARGENITGNVAFNSLTTGLLVPTILLGLCAVMARGKRPEVYINILGGLALAGALTWVTAMIRFLFNGPKINLWSVNFGPMELWTISTVWLAFGIMLLALGVWRKEQALRIASGVVIILTVLKAFLLDMAGLEGVLRALSFVALGLILIVIGRAYQRFWISGDEEE